MGRGRQKAKQTRVARELKYHSSSIDVTALQRELAGEPINPPSLDDDEDDEDDDPYADYADEDEDDDEPTGYASQRGRR
jgi:hypothetical protein